MISFITQGVNLLECYIFESVFGILSLDKNGNIIDSIMFDKNAEKVADKMGRIQNGEFIKDYEKMMTKLADKDISEVIIEDKRIGKAIREKYEFKVTEKFSSKVGEIFRSKLPDLAVELGFVSNIEEYFSWLNSVGIFLARRKIKKESEKRDKLIAQAIEALDDIDKTLNLFSNRIREWYGLHFPELNRLISSHQTFAQLISKIGLKEKFNLENIIEVSVLQKNKAEEIVQEVKSSMGAKINEEDIRPISIFANVINDLFQIRRTIEEYIDEAMTEIGPNIKGLVGSMLGARLIRLAGGIYELARFPASTVQVLGAEKALFRSLKDGSNPPKHGIIYQHPEIHRSPRWQRGKIARAVSGKLSIAARVDAFSGEYIADELKEDLETKINQIREKYKEPPPKKKPKRETKTSKRRKKKEKKK